MRSSGIGGSYTRSFQLVPGWKLLCAIPLAHLGEYSKELRPPETEITGSNSVYSRYRYDFEPPGPGVP
jgi:hypothetical protein